MINFINFIAMLAWAFFKLLSSLMMCGIVIIVLKPLSKEVAEIFSEMWNNLCWTWQEIKAADEAEWGDTP